MTNEVEKINIYKWIAENHDNCTIKAEDVPYLFVKFLDENDGLKCDICRKEREGEVPKMACAEVVMQESGKQVVCHEIPSSCFIELMTRYPNTYTKIQNIRPPHVFPPEDFDDEFFSELSNALEAAGLTKPSNSLEDEEMSLNYAEYMMEHVSPAKIFEPGMTTPASFIPNSTSLSAIQSSVMLMSDVEPFSHTPMRNFFESTTSATAKKLLDAHPTNPTKIISTFPTTKKSIPSFLTTSILPEASKPTRSTRKITSLVDGEVKTSKTTPTITKKAITRSHYDPMSKAKVIAGEVTKPSVDKVIEVTTRSLEVSTRTDFHEVESSTSEAKIEIFSTFSFQPTEMDMTSPKTTIDPIEREIVDFKNPILECLTNTFDTFKNRINDVLPNAISNLFQENSSHAVNSENSSISSNFSNKSTGISTPKLTQTSGSTNSSPYLHFSEDAGLILDIGTEDLSIGHEEGSPNSSVDAKFHPNSGLLKRIQTSKIGLPVQETKIMKFSDIFPILLREFIKSQSIYAAFAHSPLRLKIKKIHDDGKIKKPDKSQKTFVSKIEKIVSTELKIQETNKEDDPKKKNLKNGKDEVKLEIMPNVYFRKDLQQRVQEMSKNRSFEGSTTKSITKKTFFDKTTSKKMTKTIILDANLLKMMPYEVKYKKFPKTTDVEPDMSHDLMNFDMLNLSNALQNSTPVSESFPIPSALPINETKVIHRKNNSKKHEILENVQKRREFRIPIIRVASARLYKLLELERMAEKHSTTDQSLQNRIKNGTKQIQDPLKWPENTSHLSKTIFKISPTSNVVNSERKNLQNSVKVDIKHPKIKPRGQNLLMLTWNPTITKGLSSYMLHSLLNFGEKPKLEDTALFIPLSGGSEPNILGEFQQDEESKSEFVEASMISQLDETYQKVQSSNRLEKYGKKTENYDLKKLRGPFIDQEDHIFEVKNHFKSEVNPSEITEEDPVHEISQFLCHDYHRLCKFWAKHKECDLNPFWMRVNCQRSCDSCGEKFDELYKPKNVEGCQNNDPLCPFWWFNGECEKNPAWMMENCRLSCMCIYGA